MGFERICPVAAIPIPEPLVQCAPSLALHLLRSSVAPIPLAHAQLDFFFRARLAESAAALTNSRIAVVQADPVRLLQQFTGGALEGARLPPSCYPAGLEVADPPEEDSA